MNLDLTSWNIQSKNRMKTDCFKCILAEDARALFRVV